MVLLAGIAAIAYAFMLLPFKGFPLIPGVAEIRPAAVLPVLFGILFGPAGAWGCALGNALGDYFGATLTLGSAFGALGNFCFAMTAYKSWFAHSQDDGFRLSSGADIARYARAAVLACATVAFIIAWGLEAVRIGAFGTVGSIILLNNLVAALVLGPFLFKLLLNRFKAWRLYWKGIMNPEDISGGLAPVWSLRFLWIGAAGGLAVGVLVSNLLYHNSLMVPEIVNMDPAVAMITLPFLILLLLALLLA